MKKNILIFCLFFKFGMTFSQISTFQRIAIPATTFELSTTDVVEIVPSFCSDFNRASPEIKATNFDYVHLDDKCVTIGCAPPISLQEAMDNKYIDLEVNGYSSVKFLNLKKTNETIKVSTKRDIVVGDVKNDSKNIVLSKDLKATRNKNEQIQIQQAFWEKQSLLQSLFDLNYIDESNFNNEAVLKDAIKKYQGNNNLVIDGIIGPNTKEDIFINHELKKYLPEESRDLNTSNTIIDFQKTYGLEATGKFDDKTSFKFRTLEAINNQITKHTPLFNFFKDKLNGTVFNILSQIQTNETKSFIEGEFAYVISPNMEITIKQFEEAIVDAELKSDTEEDMFKSLQKFIKNKTKSYQFSKNKIIKNGFIVVESHALSNKDLLLFNNNYQKSISYSQNLNENIEFLHLGFFNRDENEIKFQLGNYADHLAIDMREINFQDKLMSDLEGKIRTNSQAKIVILTRDDFARTHSESDASSFFLETDFRTFKTELINPQNIIEQLRSRFPDKFFYMGGNLEKDANAINAMPKISSSSDVTAITAPKSLEVNYDLLSNDNVKRTFQEKKINVINLDNPSLGYSETSSNVILITGHKDKSFEKYLGKLLETIDVKDKVIVTFSCFKEGNDFLNSYVINRFKANSIVYFPTKIHPDATKKVLLTFSEMVSNNSNNRTIRELIEQSIDEAHTKETDGFLKSEINKLRQFIHQTSFNYNIEDGNPNFKI